ncbi:hypothetical protein MNBD_GAMMA12-2165 [hydrothermal vent metagenome]|uniref:Uncharacterized protein n=1 Tax=hydrothermal vent metagenome TaxID=652676 RepID=A0A3B0YPH1_9ZZZZ
MKFFTLILLIFPTLSISTAGQSTQKIDPSNIKILKRYKTTSILTVKPHQYPTSALQSTSIPGLAGRKLFSLTGKRFKKPLQIRQWEKYRKKLKQGPHSKNLIINTILESADEKVYIAQHSTNSNDHACRIFDSATQKLYKPITCTRINDAVIVLKTYKPIDTPFNARYGYLTPELEAYSTPSLAGTKLYSLTGKLFKKPLIIRQWSKYPESLDSDTAAKQPIINTITEFSKGMVYISQKSDYVGYKDCRIFNSDTQQLYKPTHCIDSEVMHTSYSVIDDNLLLLFGGQEGGGYFGVMTYSNQGKQVILLRIQGYGSSSQKIHSYKNGILSFSSNCDVVNDCVHGKDYHSKFKFHYTWSKKQGLVAKTSAIKFN